MISTAIGLLLFCFLGVTGRVDNVDMYYDSVVAGQGVFNMQLGGFLFITDASATAHEYGHWEQEKILGRWYLPIIGGASLINQLRYQLYRISADAYYRAWPEAWATQLGLATLHKT